MSSLIPKGFLILSKLITCTNIKGRSRTNHDFRQVSDGSAIDPEIAEFDVIETLGVKWIFQLILNIVK